MSNDIDAGARKVLEMFGACAGAPDDVELGDAANQALAELDALLAEAGVEPGK